MNRPGFVSDVANYLSEILLLNSIHQAKPREIIYFPFWPQSQLQYVWLWLVHVTLPVMTEDSAASAQFLIF